MYYNFNKSSRDIWRRPSLQILDKRGPGNIPFAYNIAAETAMDIASSHRMYSEAMGLWHLPINPAVRAQVGLGPIRWTLCFAAESSNSPTSMATARSTQRSTLGN